MKRLLPALMLALAASALLGACGPSSQAPSTNINVTMTDFEYSPRTFTVPAGQAITFRASNNGAVEHTFVIMKFGIQVLDKFSDADLANVYWQTKLGPGESQTQTFTAPAVPGEYQVVCDTPGHFQAGMFARLIVK
jgi:plastocyanin